MKTLTTFRSRSQAASISGQFFSSSVTLDNLEKVWATALPVDLVKASRRYSLRCDIVLVFCERVSVVFRPVLPVAPTMRIVLGAMIDCWFESVAKQEKVRELWQSR